MQIKINNKVQIGQALNPLKNAAKLSSINNTSDLKDVFTKIENLKKLWDDGSMKNDLIRYLLLWLNYQGKVKLIMHIHKKCMPVPIGLI